MRATRTVRRPTRWTPEEWRRVEDAARAKQIPPARFVREAVLGAVHGGAAGAAPAPRPRRMRDELVHQLGRVLNNLRQLEGVALDHGAPALAEATGYVARAVEEAIRRAPRRARDAAPLVEELITSGRALNEVVHLPSEEEAIPALRSVYHFVKRVLR